jgi:hypothetical protein
MTTELEDRMACYDERQARAAVNRIELTIEEAQRLRDAYRAETTQRELHEIAQLRARIAALEAISARRAVLESIADAHDFDATEVWEFDFQARTLTKKG